MVTGASVKGDGGDGVYEEGGAGGGWYRREELMDDGYYGLLYPVSGERWVLGRGRTYEERDIAVTTGIS